MLASDSGYSFKDAPTKSRVGLRASISSGDTDPDSSNLGTFNAFFPRGNYFGEMAVVGPRNLINFGPTVKLNFTDNLSMLTSWFLFWRASDDDGVYGIPGNLIRSGRGSDERYIGNQTEVVVSYRFARYFEFNTIYSHFFAGDFIQQTGAGQRHRLRSHRGRFSLLVT